MMKQLVAYLVGYVTYNLYFHPLRDYPGPFWARASLLWRIRHSMGGRFHRHIEKCHERYGEFALSRRGDGRGT